MRLISANKEVDTLHQLLDKGIRWRTNFAGFAEK
jgi:hypothetical protein